ncbi:putative Ribosomal protein L1p L10e family [Trypanosoma vivax]|uniref:Ribosomal protein L1p/L10e family n=1 Tax=Trypanosoma vivax (strain Y486) TaxID=1055687 RepID=G0U589_TRYVY|nr:hypothetical protein TRVL_04007 [Trypanosoma vivax]KAH8616583.1 putative Ribosomal protein L1p L10e family [Trypanosoma vivax]CCC51037.1 conserved hypothetical protein [Trypanosoma vivax Y486]
MPQDKRLIVTKAVLYKIKRVSSNEAESVGVFIEFLVPPVVVAQNPELVSRHVFQLPQHTYPRNGRSTCLIVPKVISTSAFKINKRHGYYDAVVTAEAICKRGDAEASRRAAQVAAAFAHFVVDARIVPKLPICITSEAAASGTTATPLTTSVKGKREAITTSTKWSSSPSSALTSTVPRKCVTPLYGLEEGKNLTFLLSQGVVGAVLRSRKQGHLYVRVGHGGMTAGDVCENAKSFIYALKRDFPTVWKYVHEFQMTSSVTEPIRFMEVHLQR